MTPMPVLALLLLPTPQTTASPSLMLTSSYRSSSGTNAYRPSLLRAWLLRQHLPSLQDPTASQLMVQTAVERQQVVALQRAQQ